MAAPGLSPDLSRLVLARARELEHAELYARYSELRLVMERSHEVVKSLPILALRLCSVTPAREAFLTTPELAPSGGPTFLYKTEDRFFRMLREQGLRFAVKLVMEDLVRGPRDPGTQNGDELPAVDPSTSVEVETAVWCPGETPAYRVKTFDGRLEDVVDRLTARLLERGWPAGPRFPTAVAPVYILDPETPVYILDAET